MSLRKSSDLAAYECNGCAVCLLSCPVWRQSHDQTLTFCGRMRSMQGGAELHELKASVDNCTLCGSCEPVCSYGVESVMRTIDMRVLLRDEKRDSGEPEAGRVQASGRVFLAGPMLIADRESLEKTLACLDGVTLFQDNGDDLSKAMEAGGSITTSRINGFMDSLDSASEIIVSDGLLYRLIRRFSTHDRVHTLGEAMIAMSEIQSQIGPDDMYVIDARAYNSDFKRLVGFYDNIRRTTGVMMNLDLHRVAIPTGASFHSPPGIVDPVSQAEWILKGRVARRIIVERLEDMGPFRSATDIPVVFLAGLG